MVFQRVSEARWSFIEVANILSEKTGILRAESVAREGHRIFSEKVKGQKVYSEKKTLRVFPEKDRRSSQRKPDAHLKKATWSIVFSSKAFLKFSGR